MLAFVTTLVLLLFALLGIALSKTYYSWPPKELKRRARQGDELAGVLYRAVAYGAELRLLLWIGIGLAAAGGLVIFTRVAPPLLAFLAVASLIWYGFGWMPSGRVGRLGARLAVALTPGLAWLLSYVHPVLEKVLHFVQSRRPVRFHTGIYEREDLVELMEDQKHLPDSRISHGELDLAIHALTFGDKLVQDFMVPRRVVKMVSAEDVIGPILMDELHDSGFSRFPVYEDKQHNIIGTLYLRDLVEAKHGGKVSAVMQRHVYYVHEDHSLHQVLHAFLVSKHHLFIVVNSFEEYVGIITIEDVMEQVIGHPIQDESDKYDDMRAVAAHHARQEHDARETVPETVTEVVE